MPNGAWKGLTVDKDGRFRVRINWQGKRFYLGKWDDPVEAARVYDRVAVMLMGHGAATNFGVDAALADEECPVKPEFLEQLHKHGGKAMLHGVPPTPPPWHQQQQQQEHNQHPSPTTAPAALGADGGDTGVWSLATATTAAAATAAHQLQPLNRLPGAPSSYGPSRSPIGRSRTEPYLTPRLRAATWSPPEACLLTNAISLPHASWAPTNTAPAAATLLRPQPPTPAAAVMAEHAGGPPLAPTMSPTVTLSQRLTALQCHMYASSGLWSPSEQLAPRPPLPATAWPQTPPVDTMATTNTATAAAAAALDGRSVRAWMDFAQPPAAAAAPAAASAAGSAPVPEPVLAAQAATEALRALGLISADAPLMAVQPAAAPPLTPPTHLQPAASPLALSPLGASLTPSNVYCTASPSPHAVAPSPFSPYATPTDASPCRPQPAPAFLSLRAATSAPAPSPPAAARANISPVSMAAGDESVADAEVAAMGGLDAWLAAIGARDGGMSAAGAAGPSPCQRESRVQSAPCVSATHPPVDSLWMPTAPVELNAELLAALMQVPGDGA